MLLNHGTPQLELPSEFGKQPGAFSAYTFLPVNYSIDVQIKGIDFL